MSIQKEIEASYDLKVNRVTKVRDVYRIRSDKRRVYCFKSFEVPESEVYFISRVLTHLAQQGFRYSPKLTVAKDQLYWVTVTGKLYMLTNWIRGRSPDFSVRSEFQKAIRTLARFHQHAQGIQAEDAPVGRNRYQWLNGIIDSYKETLNRHAARDPKELAEPMSQFTSLCDTATHYLNQPRSLEAIHAEQAVGAFVHGDYNYPNLIVDAKGGIQLIDFENTSMQVRMTDLSHILHRNCAWKGSDTIRWIEAYDRVRPLTSQDRYLLYALLHVPYPLIRSIRRNKKSSQIRSAMPSTREVDRYLKKIAELL